MEDAAGLHCRWYQQSLIEPLAVHVCIGPGGLEDYLTSPALVEAYKCEV